MINQKALPFLLQYDNIARYEDGVVWILDRRIYPQVKFHRCETYHAVAEAIRNMVTQSAGPYTAIGLGIAQAATVSRDVGTHKFSEIMDDAVQVLSNARPTQKARYAMIARSAAAVGTQAMEEGNDPVQAILEHVKDALDKRYDTMACVGKALVDVLPQRATLLTQCYAETVLGGIVLAAREQGKQCSVICPETRPFFQGARLTASVFHDAGWDTTVISDNMVANVLSQGKIDVFTSAADTFSEEGAIVNKVGTLGIAHLAKIYAVPYYVTGVPEQGIHIQDFVIEERDATELFTVGGLSLVQEGVKGYYPSFDIVPPELITGIVTEIGIFEPQRLSDYFRQSTLSYYR